MIISPKLSAKTECDIFIWFVGMVSCVLTVLIGPPPKLIIPMFTLVFEVFLCHPSKQIASHAFTTHQTIILLATCYCPINLDTKLSIFSHPQVMFLASETTLREDV